MGPDGEGGWNDRDYCIVLPSMAQKSPPTHGRLAVYSYLRPLIEGRRVLELGSGTGEGAAHLLGLGARTVFGTDEDSAALEAARRKQARPGLTFVPRTAVREGGPFEVVIVPEATALLRGTERLNLTSLREMLGPTGKLVCLVGNGDLEGAGNSGLAYYDVVDALSPHFPRVRMFGQTPFAAFGIAEFDDAAGGLRVDSGLVADSGEQPDHYLAVAGPDEEIALGYALVQVPLGALGVAPPAPAAAPAAAAPTDASVAELRRKLAEAEGQAEGVLRVSRAQVEEIEELRARLRRSAESRAELDEEVNRLRRALADNNESVMSLTRRTTEEMTSLAQRLTAGLRGGPREESPQTAALVEKLREREAALAARESALSDRDDRIAALEAERQDLAWRLDAAEDDLQRAGGPSTEPRAPLEGDLLATLQAREQALEEYRRAAGAHLEEVARLRDALGEQSAAVSELEESLSQAEKKLQAAELENTRLRRLAAETEDADRQRRSRLAELEGTLLRLQRQAANGSGAPAPRTPPPVSDEVPKLLARVKQLEREVERLQAELHDTERSRDEAEFRWDEAAGRIVGLERAAAEKDEHTQTEESLRARINELESRADGGRLSTALAEVDRLRTALERSEEQLWEARGRLLANRERLEAFERMTAASEGQGAGPARLPHELLDELGALESGLRAEAARLAAVERTLAEWRTALSVPGAATASAPPASEG
jgi:SAM-dependent methyltransferase